MPKMEMVLNDDGVVELVQAIVHNAANDHKNAQKKLKKNPNNLAAQKILDDTERFFKSDWFETLTGLEGEGILKRLQNNEMIKGKRNKGTRRKV